MYNPYFHSTKLTASQMLCIIAKYMYSCYAVGGGGYVFCSWRDHCCVVVAPMKAIVEPLLLGDDTTFIVNRITLPCIIGSNYAKLMIDIMFYVMDIIVCFQISPLSGCHHSWQMGRRNIKEIMQQRLGYHLS